MNARGKSCNSVWVVEDCIGHLRPAKGKQVRGSQNTLRLYEIRNGGFEAVADMEYEVGTPQRPRTRMQRAELVFSLLRTAKAQSGTVVCSYRTAHAHALLSGFRDMSLPSVVELDRRATLKFVDRIGRARNSSPAVKLRRAVWQDLPPMAPDSDTRLSATILGNVNLSGFEKSLTCFAIAPGGITQYARSVQVGVATLPSDTPLEVLAKLLGWMRWIRPMVRRSQRMTYSEGSAAVSDRNDASIANDDGSRLSMKSRPNRRLGREHDVFSASELSLGLTTTVEPRQKLVGDRSVMNVAELFAGAGGMGLGFLLSSALDQSNTQRFRMILSAELNPTYVNTLRINHDHIRSAGIRSAEDVPETVEPTDLCTMKAADSISAAARERGGVDILIGGPPCQGFSNANRNSWSSSNPNNTLIDKFIDYVSLLGPRALLLENVQGILWTPKSGDGNRGLSVAKHVVKRLEECGYVVYPKLLNAAWYGVPQYRDRFFLLGLHQDLGYGPADFGDWGPFPLPEYGPWTDTQYVSVWDAIRDLPAVENGENREEIPYVEPVADNLNPFLRKVRANSPAKFVFDHVTSRHAPYVIERYRKIPAGGNWKDIADMMTNYAGVERTHSNIYRRLTWHEPSITIGHYRKSMIVHPSQHRGLSLREASRLQGFPDWFRFAGFPDAVSGGVSHKQQQLANAVCPIVTSAVARHLLTL